MTVSKDVLQFMLRSWCPNCDYASLNIQSMQDHLGQCTNNETYEKPNIKVEPIEDEEFVDVETTGPENIKLEPDLKPKVHVIKFTKASVKENLQPKVTKITNTIPKETKPVKKRQRPGRQDERCPDCGKLYYDRCNLARHIWRVHRELYFRCRPCKVYFEPRTMDPEKANSQCRALQIKHSKCIQ